MNKRNYTVAILCLVVFLLLPGCKSKDEDKIVSPMLYQKSGSFANALKFIEMPEDKMETSLSFLKDKGKLADKRQLAFANKLISLRKSKDFELFKSLLSEGTKSQLGNDDNRGVVHQYLRQIDEGAFIYGQDDVKFFATFREFTEAENEKLKKHVRFADAPTHVLHYWHRRKPGSMLIGSSFYLVQDKGSYKIVTETLLQGELTLETKQPKIVEQKKNVSVSFQQTDDAYEKENIWKYQWKIELSLAETAANNFEMLKLTEIISVQGHADIHPGIARQTLIKEDVFDKYKGEQLSFMFYLGDKEPIDNVTQYGLQLIGWDFAFSMANISRSDYIYFYGNKITNARANWDAKFVGSNLELMSFGTEKDSVRYKNRIVLRKTPTKTESPGVLPVPKKLPVKSKE